MTNALLQRELRAMIADAHALGEAEQVAQPREGGASS